MSTEAEELLNALDRNLRDIEKLPDTMLRQRLLRPEQRAEAIAMRDTLRPWLPLINRLANIDRRLERALKATSRERRL